MSWPEAHSGFGSCYESGQPTVPWYDRNYRYYMAGGIDAFDSPETCSGKALNPVGQADWPYQELLRHEADRRKY